jgi:hypothetical protein
MAQGYSTNAQAPKLFESPINEVGLSEAKGLGVFTFLDVSVEARIRHPSCDNSHNVGFSPALGVAAVHIKGRERR